MAPPAAATNEALDNETRLVQLHTSYAQDNKQTMADRRRINGPAGGTKPPLYASTIKSGEKSTVQRPVRVRGPEELRKICRTTCALEMERFAADQCFACS
jgi:hypothetical protein